MLYQKNVDEIQPFITLEKTVHIFRLLAENMNYFPDYDKELCLKIFHPQEIAERQNALPFFRNI